MPRETEDHKFDRRAEDANVAALALRVRIVEGRVENVEHKLETNNRELAANTALTRQTHENTEAIVEAVKWFSTAKRLAFSTLVGVGALSGTIVGTFKALHMLGLLK